MVHDDFSVVDNALRLRVAGDFADDWAHEYERYMAGELTFIEQRILRVQRAYGLASVPASGALALTGWCKATNPMFEAPRSPSQTFTRTLRRYPALRGPFGAVSNNVAAYQRQKLRLAGLDMFEVVIGSDTAGAPKPDAAPFLAGCEQLGTAPGRTLYVGDNLINDVVGVRNAGLPAVLLDRGARHKNSESARVENLTELTHEIRENSRDLAARAAGAPSICFFPKTPV